jgi:hypothetical protein
MALPEALVCAGVVFLFGLVFLIGAWWGLVRAEWHARMGGK